MVPSSSNSSSTSSAWMSPGANLGFTSTSSASHHHAPTAATSSATHFLAVAPPSDTSSATGTVHHSSTIPGAAYGQPHPYQHQFYPVVPSSTSVPVNGVLGGPSTGPAPSGSDYSGIDPALLLYGQTQVVTPPHPSVSAAASLDPPALLLQQAGTAGFDPTSSSTAGTRQSARRAQHQAGLQQLQQARNASSAAQLQQLQQQAQETHGQDGDDDDEDDDQAVYCICKAKDDGSPMVECGLCEDWFHLRCVGLSKRAVDKLKSYVCPPCTAKMALSKPTLSKDKTKRPAVVKSSSPPSDRSSPADSEADSAYEPPSENVPSTGGQNAVKRKSQSEGSVSTKKAKLSATGSPGTTAPIVVKSETKGATGKRSSSDAFGSSTSNGTVKKQLSSSSTSSSAQSSTTDWHSLHDPYREIVRKHCIQQFINLFDGMFPRSSKSTSSEAPSAAQAYAFALESALFKLNAEPVPLKTNRFQVGKAYKDRFRTLLFSLKDQSNTTLRAKIVSGELPANLLAKMSHAELANDEIKSKVEKAQRESLASSILKKEAGVMRKMTHKGEVEIQRGGEDSSSFSNESSKEKDKTGASTSGPSGGASMIKKLLSNSSAAGKSGSPGSSGSPRSPLGATSRSTSVSAATSKAAGQSAALSAGKGASPATSLPSIPRKTSAPAALTSKGKSPSDAGATPSTPASTEGADSPSTKFNFGSLWTGSPGGDESGGASTPNIKSEFSSASGAVKAEVSPDLPAQHDGDGETLDLGDLGVSDDLIDKFLDDTLRDGGGASAANTQQKQQAVTQALAAVSTGKKPTPSAPSGPRAATGSRGGATVRGGGGGRGGARGRKAGGPVSGANAQPVAKRSGSPPRGPSAASSSSKQPPSGPSALSSINTTKLPDVPKRGAVPLKSALKSSSSNQAGKAGEGGGSEGGPPAAKFPSRQVWSGAMTMPDEGTFSGTVRQIGGRPLGTDPRVWSLFFPDPHTTIEGRLPSQMAEDYLVASTHAHRTEVVAFVLERALVLHGLAMAGDDAPLTEAANQRGYEKVIRYFAGRGRYGVLGSDPSARGRIIKDFYVASLPASAPVPAWLSGLVPGGLDTYEPDLEMSRKGVGRTGGMGSGGGQREDVFILAAVLFKGALDAELESMGPAPSSISGLGTSVPPSLDTVTTSASSSAAIPADPLAGLLGAGGASALQDLLKSVGGGATPDLGSGSTFEQQPNQNPPPIALPASNTLPDPFPATSGAGAAPSSSSTSEVNTTMPASTASALAQVPTDKLEPLLLANPGLVDQLMASLKEQGKLGDLSALFPAGQGEAAAGPAPASAADDEYVPSAPDSGISGFAAMGGGHGAYPAPGPTYPGSYHPYDSGRSGYSGGRGGGGYGRGRGGHGRGGWQ
ncbi:Transcription factor bye1 [Tilletia horrida]|uniref:Transcription factor BYE1 n=1 Tax=Tilletia horrida TaxID=155126 RepID=A0AAN6JWM4_9BASI|nr:Transcription factor bye1 [Tilletia horrida]